MAKYVYKAGGGNPHRNCKHWHKTKSAAFKCATKHKKKYGGDWYVRQATLPLRYNS